MMAGEYIRFEVLEAPGPKRKTPVYGVFVKDTGPGASPLGEIRWWGAWRCFTFWPAPNTIYERQCLLDVIKFMDSLMADRKQGVPYPLT